MRRRFRVRCLAVSTGPILSKKIQAHQSRKSLISGCMKTPSPVCEPEDAFRRHPRDVSSSTRDSCLFVVVLILVLPSVVVVESHGGDVDLVVAPAGLSRGRRRRPDWRGEAGARLRGSHVRRGGGLHAVEGEDLPFGEVKVVAAGSGALAAGGLCENVLSNVASNIKIEKYLTKRASTYTVYTAFT